MVAQKRWATTINSKGIMRLDTRNAIQNLRNIGQIDMTLCERLLDGHRFVVLGIATKPETLALIDAAIDLLEAWDPKPSEDAASVPHSRQKMVRDGDGREWAVGVAGQIVGR